ncbi:MAG: hypothetical protein OEZ59_00315 [Deltaproteobacteria bacterium]|nr:hypothetical protein [Deltaproteobacteria bacterium]
MDASGLDNAGSAESIASAGIKIKAPAAVLKKLRMNTPPCLLLIECMFSPGVSNLTRKSLEQKLFIYHITWWQDSA